MAALTVSGADLGGSWSGSVNLSREDGSTREDKAAATLKQTGETVSGTIGPPDNPFEITTGKITGNKLNLIAGRPGEEGTLTFDFTIAGDAIEGTVVMKRGDVTRNGTIKLKKQ